MKRIFGDISQRKFVNNMIANDDGTTGEPTYYTYYRQATDDPDPVFTLQCKNDPFMRPDGKCPIEGMPLGIPAGAERELGSHANAGDDRHMTIVDQDSGWEYDLWQVNANGLPASGGILSFSWGGRTRIDGDGLTSDEVGAPDSQGRTYVGDATAARWGSLAGRVRAEELALGQIRHALFIGVNCVSNYTVYPARGKGTQCSKLKPPLGPLSDQDAPPLGAHLQLNMAATDIDNLPITAWQKTLLHAMAEYGMFIGDTGAEGYFVIEQEAGNQYQSVTQQVPKENADAWLTFASQNWRRGAVNAAWPWPNWVGCMGSGCDRDHTASWWKSNVWDHLRVLAPPVPPP
jgi:hypothetical protein